MEKIFDKIINSIPKGYKPTQEELLPYLTLENTEERAFINYKLAEAYFLSGAPSLFNQAAIFAKRACFLSDYNKNYSELYINILRNLNDTEAIKDVYKQIGLVQLSNGNVKEALIYFDNWQYTYANEERIDKYSYDREILKEIDNYTSKYRKDFSYIDYSNTTGKIRIGYLVKDITTINSVLVKINLIFARQHDQNKFIITWFVPETENEVIASPQGKETLNELAKTKCEIVFADQEQSYEKQLVSVARKIYEHKTQILITSAALAFFNHYFIISMKPAQIMIGLLQGPPPQFIAQILNHAIAWTYHPMFDSPVNTSYIQLEMELNEVNSDKLLTKRDFKLDANTIVIMSGGRPVKFQDKSYWKTIISILKKYHNVVFIVAGTTKEQVPFFNDIINSDVESRITFLGWKENYLEIANVADVIIDTFPSGGGVYLLEVMKLGKPVITFSNDYFKEFSQVEWSPISEFACVPELKISRGNFEEFEAKISILIENKDLRNKVGEVYKELVKGVNNPNRMVRKCEKVYNETFIKYITEKLIENIIILKTQSFDINFPEEYNEAISNKLVDASTQLINDEEFDNAIKLLKFNLNISPNSPDDYNNLAICYYKLGNVEIALEYFDKAINLNKTNSLYFLNKADILKSINRTDEAKQMLTKFLDDHPNENEVKKSLEML